MSPSKEDLTCIFHADSSTPIIKVNLKNYTGNHVGPPSLGINRRVPTPRLDEPGRGQEHRHQDHQQHRQLQYIE